MAACLPPVWERAIIAVQWGNGHRWLREVTGAKCRAVSVEYFATYGTDKKAAAENAATDKKSAVVKSCWSKGSGRQSRSQEVGMLPLSSELPLGSLKAPSRNRRGGLANVADVEKDPM